MSPFRVALSPQATADLRAIEASSLRKWGEAQTVKYMADIDRAIGRISELPFSAPALSDVDRDERRMTARHHRIFYRIENDTVNILRILHERQASKYDAHPDQSGQ
jgi:toxin ParE1/3/4